jgi:hypothetical protein
MLLIAGVVQSLAYLLTGNIWLTSGVHAGANIAAFSVSGLWHAGGVVSVTGQPSFPNWLAVMLMLTVFGVGFALSQRNTMRLESHGKKTPARPLANDLRSRMIQFARSNKRR